MRVRFLVSLLALCLFFQVPLARSNELAERLILATYKLSNEASTATCLIVRCETEDGAPQSFIVTANHVLQQMKGDCCMVVSRTRDQNGRFRRHEIRVSVRAEGKPLWKKHPDHDLALLRLPDSVDVQALPLDSLATEQELGAVYVGDSVRLAVFPERTEANDAGFPILRSGSIASYPLLPVKSHPMFLVDSTSWTGDSGGPVIHESMRSPSGGPLVIGFVLGMRNIVDTVKESRFVERKTRFPLDISEVLHATLARELISEYLSEE